MPRRKEFCTPSVALRQLPLGVSLFEGIVRKVECSGKKLESPRVIFQPQCAEGTIHVRRTIYENIVFNSCNHRLQFI